MFAEEDGTITHVFAEGAEPSDLVRVDHIVTGFEVGLMRVESDGAILLTLSLLGEEETATVVVDPETARAIAVGLVTAVERI